MKANNLTVSIPYRGCDKNCPYCISKITGNIVQNLELMGKNTPIVRKYSERAGIESVLFTGKGEPFLNISDLDFFSRQFEDFPQEVQTNGLMLNNNYKNWVNTVFFNTINTFAFSIDDLSQLATYQDMFNFLVSKGKLIRICVNITNKINGDLRYILSTIAAFPVTYVLLRNITFPQNSDMQSPQVCWIKHNVDIERWKFLKTQYAVLTAQRQPLRVFDFGMKVYSLYGMSVALSDYCVQESFMDQDLRSLIFLEDGHLYTSWSDKASILF